MSSTFWKDEEIALLEALRPYLNTREIQQVFAKLKHDRTMEAISKKARSINVAFKDFGTPNYNGLNNAEKSAIKEIIGQRNTVLETMHPSIELSPSRKAGQNMKMREATLVLLQELQELRNSVPRTSSVSTKRMSGGKESLVVLVSDNHFGATVKDDAGHFIYNIDIAIKRVHETPDILFSRMDATHAANIDEVIVVLAGDHVDGEGVYPGQEHNLETFVAEQVRRCTKAMWHMIRRFQELFPHALIRIVTTRGNHGRGGTSPESNWDHMLYQQLELLVDMQNNPNLIIKNRYGNFNTFEVKGWRGMVRHKAPVQAESGSSIAKYAGWHGIHEWDFFLFGHYHHWGVMTWNGKPIVRNGSAMGGNDYAEEFGAYDKPAQIAFTMSESKLPLDIYPIHF